MTSTRSSDRVFGIPAVWFGALGAPVVWSVSFLVSLVFTQWACSVGLGQAEVLGVGLIKAVNVAVILITAVVTLYAGWVAYRIWKAADGGESLSTRELTPTRCRFMGLFGMIAAALFLASLVYRVIGVLLLSPCLY